MKKSMMYLLILICFKVNAQQKTAQNPIIFADVPDLSMIRVGDTYYMSSTTMHMSPGLPIMKSKDLVNWKMVSYAYDTLITNRQMDLSNGNNAYGKGSWASSLRYHKGVFYASTFSATSGKTHIYTTKDIEKGPWLAISFKPSLHDHSLFFDDDNRIYMIYGGKEIKMVELKPDLSGIMPGSKEQTIIKDANAPSGDGGLPAEGSQLFKIKGKYYLFNISWPRGSMRTVLVHRADKINGPYEGKIALKDLGVAQGGLIDMPDGTWYSYLFRDFGAVGRIPYLVPVKWEEGWPVLGYGGKVPEMLNLPASEGLLNKIVASDEFSRKKNDKSLPLVWQWNHNPDNKLWSVSERKGFLRLRTGNATEDFLQAKNTLTQRTFGPVSVGETVADVSKMQEGDVAGLSLLQKNYGLIAVKMINNSKKIIMVNAGSGIPETIEEVSLQQDKVYFKAECNFADRKDVANFYYSLDGKTWKSIGGPLKMSYTLPHFMGYRFGLFNYATKSAGGFVDFDFFRIGQQNVNEIK